MTYDSTEGLSISAFESSDVSEAIRPEFRNALRKLVKKEVATRSKVSELVSDFLLFDRRSLRFERHYAMKLFFLTSIFAFTKHRFGFEELFFNYYCMQSWCLLLALFWFAQFRNICTSNFVVNQLSGYKRFADYGRICWCWRSGKKFRLLCFYVSETSTCNFNSYNLSKFIRKMNSRMIC